jgi:hypothetical protein
LAGNNGSTGKRRTGNFETPAAKASRSQMMSSPGDMRTPENLGTP